MPTTLVVPTRADRAAYVANRSSGDAELPEGDGHDVAAAGARPYADEQIVLAVRGIRHRTDHGHAADLGPTQRGVVVEMPTTPVIPAASTSRASPLAPTSRSPRS